MATHRGHLVVFAMTEAVYASMAGGGHCKVTPSCNVNNSCGKDALGGVEDV